MMGIYSTKKTTEGFMSTRSRSTTQSQDSRLSASVQDGLNEEFMCAVTSSKTSPAVQESGIHSKEKTYQYRIKMDRENAAPPH